MELIHRLLQERSDILGDMSQVGDVHVWQIGWTQAVFSFIGKRSRNSQKIKIEWSRPFQKKK
jgi:hypothetical protein